MRARPRLDWLPAALAVIGMCLLVYEWRLSKPLWVDEEMIALNARWRSFGGLAGALWLDQSAPLGWLALERAALLVFGLSERAARAVPTLFGLGTLGVAVWIGRRWMTPIGAAILVGLCSIGPWLVFFTLELKQYSADACFALLLPALAAWSTEGTSRDAVRRGTAWWIVAALGMWLSNGATFVAPACATVIVTWAWRKHGAREAALIASAGVIWLISFGAHYTVGLRHALDNEYLRNYWSFAFPPVSDGVFATLQWTWRWFESFAVKPVGTSHWQLFWLAIIAGFAYATTRFGALGAAFAGTPLSALALGIFRLVPPFERLGLWCVPALYVGIGLCADAALWLRVPGPTRLRVLRVAGIMAAALAASIVCYDISTSGQRELGARSPDNNYGLDDRRAVRRVQSLRQPGDPVLTTHFGLAGLWWYGDVDISAPQRGAYLGDSPVFEVFHEPRAARCGRYRADLDALTKRTGRVVVYLGFRLNVLPPAFDKLALDELSRRGAAVGYGRYGELSHVAAFDLTQPPDGNANRLFEYLGPNAPSPPEGCLAVRPAQRW